MGSVLLLVDDYTATEMFATALRHAGHHVVCAISAQEAVVTSIQMQPDIAFVGLGPSDNTGTAVLRELREVSPHTVVVMMSGVEKAPSTVKAMRSVAADCLEKPIDMDQLLHLVSSIAPSTLTSDESDRSDLVRHAAARWAGLIARTIDLRDDPHTVNCWAHGVGISPGAIRAWCRAAGVRVKPSLSLARMLRVVTHYRPGSRLADLLNIVDSRTLQNFLRLGRKGAPCTLPTTVDRLLAEQRWISDGSAVLTLRSTLRSRTAAFGTAREEAISRRSSGARSVASMFRDS